MINAIFAKKNLFKVITLIFEKSAHQADSIAAFEKFKGSMIRGSDTEKESDYF